MRKTIYIPFLLVLLAILLMGCPTAVTRQWDSNLEPTEGHLYPSPATIGISSSLIIWSDDWGGGTNQPLNTIEGYYDDPDFLPALKVQQREGDERLYSTVAFDAITAGTLSDFTKLKFKIRSDDYTIIDVYMVGMGTEKVSFTIADDGRDLGNGWYEITDLIADHGAGAAAVTQVCIATDGTEAGTVGGDAGTADDGVFYVTDIRFE